MTQLTELLGRLHAGDNDARDALFAVAYAELHRLAQRLRDGGRNVTLDTTSLVHETYLRFVRVGELRAEDRRAAGDEKTILKVHEALEVLEEADPRLAQVAQMRYFGGYSDKEIAETLNVTERTVRRDWEKARLILATALK